MLPVNQPGDRINVTGPFGNTTEQQLYFWFFPSENPAATDEIMIWLNGGVGGDVLQCSVSPGLA